MRRARRYARRTGIEFFLDSRRGKGSHQTIYVGESFTTVPHGELRSGAYFAMLRDLQINPRDF